MTFLKLLTNCLPIVSCWVKCSHFSSTSITSGFTFTTIVNTVPLSNISSNLWTNFNSKNGILLTRNLCSRIYTFPSIPSSKNSTSNLAELPKNSFKSKIKAVPSSKTPLPFFSSTCPWFWSFSFYLKYFFIWRSITRFLLCWGSTLWNCFWSPWCCKAIFNPLRISSCTTVVNGPDRTISRNWSTSLQWCFHGSFWFSCLEANWSFIWARADTQNIFWRSSK